MADYYSILAKAVDALDPNTGGARRQLYDRARAAMIAKIERAMPPFDGADVAAAKVALESAIAKVEAEAVRRPMPKAAPPFKPTYQAEHPARTGRDTWLTELLERASQDAGAAEQDFAPKRARSGDE
jgi:hypothetical protein